MTDWTANLKTLDAAQLGEMDLAELNQPWTAEYSTEIYGRDVNLDAQIRTTVDHHRCIDAVEAKSLTDALGTLPAPGEAVHLWIGHGHSMGHVIAAVLKLADPAHIEDLAISTLTFSRANAEDWAALMDAGRVKTLTLLCSQYFEKTSPHLFDPAAELLRPRGARLVTLRIHSKLICARLSDGRTISAEGSANTRSAKTVEQVAIFGSREVYDFHVAQMEKAIRSRTAAG